MVHHPYQFFVDIVVYLEGILFTVIVKKSVVKQDFHCIIVSSLTIWISLDALKRFYLLIYFFIALIPCDDAPFVSYWDSLIEVTYMVDGVCPITKSSCNLYCIHIWVYHRVICYEAIGNHHNVWLTIQLYIQSIVKTACHPVVFCHVFLLPVLVCITKLL